MRFNIDVNKGKVENFISLLSIKVPFYVKVCIRLKFLFPGNAFVAPDP